jgi:hypothetical protein
LKIGNHELKIGDWLALTYPEQNDINVDTYHLKVRHIVEKLNFIAGDLYYDDGSHEWSIFELRANITLDITDALPAVVSKISIMRNAPNYPVVDLQRALISKNAARAIAHGFYYADRPEVDLEQGDLPLE